MAALDDDQSAAGDLSVEVTFDGAGEAMIRVAGEIDVATADTVRTAVAAALEHVPSALVFDLSGVDFIDSSGIAVLLEAAAKVDSVRIERPSNVVRRVIVATGLTDVLPTDD